MKKYNYHNITNEESVKTYQQYIKLLSKRYNCKNWKSLNILNKQGYNFVIFSDYRQNLYNQYKKLAFECLDYRGSSFEKGIKGFKVSEFHSSLTIEGIKSTRQIAKRIISSKKTQISKKLLKTEIEIMIENMDLAMNDILKGRDITKANIFNLFTTLTQNLPLDREMMPLGNLYRIMQVEITSSDLSGKKNDTGIKPENIEKSMNQLIAFINSDELNDMPLIKALAAHYIFEYIHPYPDYNGRMGRFIHLWILYNISKEDFKQNLYLSEAIMAFRQKFYKAFDEMNIAKSLNIDLTLWVSYLLEIFIDYNKAYIFMKRLSEKSLVEFCPKTRLFIMNILISSNNEKRKKFQKSKFQELYQGYSDTIADRVMKKIRESNLFEFNNSKPKSYWLKPKVKDRWLSYLKTNK